MNEFINELISRLEEYKSKAYVSGMTNNSYEFGACRAMDSAIDIVKQLSGEYEQSESGFVNELIDFLEENINAEKQIAEDGGSREEVVAHMYAARQFDTLKGWIESRVKRYNNGWIPCSKRLPEDGEPVMLHDHEGYLELGVARTKDGMKGFECEYEGWWSSANNYLAWQPLPEPFSPSLVQDSPSLVQDWKDSMRNTFDGREV